VCFVSAPASAVYVAGHLDVWLSGGGRGINNQKTSLQFPPNPGPYHHFTDDSVFQYTVRICVHIIKGLVEPQFTAVKA